MTEPIQSENVKIGPPAMAIPITIPGAVVQQQNGYVKILVSAHDLQDLFNVSGRMLEQLKQADPEHLG